MSLPKHDEPQQPKYSHSIKMNPDRKFVSKVNANIQTSIVSVVIHHRGMSRITSI